MDLMFVPYQNPQDNEDGQGSANISTRSHVTRLQHKKARMRRAAKTSASVRRIVAEGWRKAPSAHQASETPESDEEEQPKDQKTIVPVSNPFLSSGWCNSGRLPHLRSVCKPTCKTEPFDPTSPRSKRLLVTPAFDKSLRPPAPSSAHVDTQILDVLQHYLKFALMGSCRVETLTMVRPAEKHRRYCLIQESIHNALSNETYLYPLLASEAAKMSHIAGSGPFYAKLADHFMSEATKRFRRWLATNAVDDQSKIFVICNIFYMGTAEWFRHNLETSAMHWSYLKPMVDPWFASEDLNDTMLFFKLCLGTQDTMMALENFEPPNFAAPWRPRQLSPKEQEVMQQRLLSRVMLDAPCERIWCQPQFSTNTNEEDRHRQTFSPFQKPVKISDEFENMLKGLLRYTTQQGISRDFIELIDSGKLSQPFSEAIMEDLVPWREISNLCWMTTSAAEDEAEWISQMAIAIIHRLLTMTTIPSYTPSSREESIRLSLIMSVGCLASPYSWRSVGRYATLVQNSLKSLEADKTFKEAYYPSRIEGEATLWTLCMGLVASSSSSSVSTDWFTSRAIKLALHLRITSFEAMFDTIAKFMLPDILRQPCMIELVEKLNGVDSSSMPRPLAELPPPL